MPEIKWNGNTNEAFSVASNWQGNAVPGINDIAVFDSSSRSCTLDSDVVLAGIMIQAGFSGIFDQNEHKITIGPEGVFHALNTMSSEILLDGEIDFAGREFMTYLVSLSRSSVNNVRIRNNCDWWYYPLGSGNQRWNNFLLDENAVLTLRTGKHADYSDVNFSKNSVFPFSGQQDIHGTIKGGPGTQSRYQLYLGNKTTLHSTAVLDATQKGLVFYSPYQPAKLETKGGYTALGDVRLWVYYGSGCEVLPGDYRDFQEVVLGTTAASQLILTVGDYMFGDLKLKNGSIIQPEGCVIECHGDILSISENGENVNMPDRIVLAGTNDQVVENVLFAKDAFYILAKPHGGNYAFTGDLVLGGKSTVKSIGAENFQGMFDQNNCELELTGSSITLTDFSSEKFTLNGIWRFSGSPEIEMRVFDFQAGTTFVFDSIGLLSCYSSSEREYPLPAITISDNARMTLALKSVPENAISRFLIHGDLFVQGTFEAGCAQHIVVGITGDDAMLTVGRLVASRDASLRIDPGKSPIRAIRLEKEGDVQIYWNSQNATASFLPGDYTAFSDWHIGDNVVMAVFMPGDYHFERLYFTAKSGGCVTISTCEIGEIYCHGTLFFEGAGVFLCNIDDVYIENMTVDTGFQMNSGILRVDHPVVNKHGTIRSNGTFVTLATAAMQFTHPDALDVDTLCLKDGDGLIAIPTTGYRSLTLSSKECHSKMVLQGIYKIENFHFRADSYPLEIDVCHSPILGISGNATSETIGNGVIRIMGNGSERWSVDGSTDQTFDMRLEFGNHVFGTLINAKPDGEIGMESQLFVFDYIAEGGNRLDALENMTILSNLCLHGTLFVTLAGSSTRYAREGLCLEEIRIPKRSIVRFYARLTDRDKNPIDPRLVEEVTLDCEIMNPVAPSLHAARASIVNAKRLPLDQVLSSEFETDSHDLGEDESYNFRLISSQIENLHFDKPGLYYVTIGVKFFGYKSSIPLRYEIYVDRNV